MQTENPSHVVLSSIKRDIRNKHYEAADGGIYLPKQGVHIHGCYEHTVNGTDKRVDPNKVPLEGINYLLNVGFHNASPIATWYLALYSGNYTPTDSITAASFTQTAGEIVSTTEGYTQTTRPEFVEDAATTGVITNAASKADFTIATATELTINGVALLSSNVRGGTTGVLASISKFAQARKLVSGDVLSLSYTVGITSA